MHFKKSHDFQNVQNHTVLLLHFQEENDRLLHYLDPSSEIHLIKTVEKQLISEHLSSILTKGLDDLLSADRKPELRLMYSLLGKVIGGHAELKGRTTILLTDSS